jgi:SAM-dependent methyltransferase
MDADKPEWFEEAAFWENFAPVMFGAERWAEAPAVVDGLARLTGIGPRVAAPGGDRPARAFDQCCGLGRITAELARRGYAACGVDLTPSYLEAACADADAEGLAVDYAQGDARNYTPPVACDLAANLYVSFGYFADPADDRRAADRLFESLRPGGAAVVETLGKELAVRDFIEGEWFERGGYTVLTEFKPVDAWAGLENRWILIDGARRLERRYVQRLYAATELRALLLAAGFRSVEIYGEWDGAEYGRNARTLIAAARK